MRSERGKGHLISRAQSIGLSKRTLERAKSTLGVRVKREGLREGSRSWWSLDEPATVADLLVNQPDTASLELAVSG